MSEGAGKGPPGLDQGVQDQGPPPPSGEQPPQGPGGPPSTTPSIPPEYDPNDLPPPYPGLPQKSADDGGSYPKIEVDTGHFHSNLPPGPGSTGPHPGVNYADFIPGHGPQTQQPSGGGHGGPGGIFWRTAREAPDVTLIPGVMQCISCQSLVQPHVIKTPSTTAWLTCMLLMCFGCEICCCLPFCIQDCYVTSLVCPQCRQHIRIQD